MTPIIKPSTELRQNYNAIAELCRSSGQPVFLTRNGSGDMVIMDIETYRRREEEMDINTRLLAAEHDRLNGVQYHTLEEFRTQVEEAIERGASNGRE
ncbi:MAG: type II toxin-antitoxin system Phd/YefM family antitoxin [Oscillospiraceae bacterium]|jgi:PHD/YefM family antitoxin component YafN of YafNO toxin-antitoxin module|nr:type II toxin-antitoxin system Phd/YefM family antitoxin [Oscillospiraceae bacterium]